MRFCLSVSLPLIALSWTVSASAAELELLGQSRLTPVVSDSDHIEVEGPCPTALNPPVRSVAVRAAGEALEIDFIAVRFGDGSVQNLPVRKTFAAGSTSRVIDLNGGARCVRDIYVRGRTISSAVASGAVQLWGIREALPSGPIGGGLSGHALGAMRFGYVTTKQDLLLGCPSAAHTAKAIQLVVRGNSAELADLELSYGLSPVDRVPIRALFARGSATRVIDLPGGSRCIRRISLSGRAVDFPGLGDAAAWVETYAID